MQKEITVEALLDSKTTGLVISSEFTKKQKFKLKKNWKANIRNVNNIFNKEGSIEYTVEVNIFYKRYKERTEINIIKK